MRFQKDSPVASVQEQRGAITARKVRFKYPGDSGVNFKTATHRGSAVSQATNFSFSVVPQSDLDLTSLQFVIVMLSRFGLLGENSQHCVVR